MLKKIIPLLFLIISGCSTRENMFSKSISEWDGFDLFMFLVIIIFPSIVGIIALSTSKNKDDQNSIGVLFIIYIIFILIVATCSS
jgi:hypothetical protein